jgi:hypothetical protein
MPAGLEKIALSRLLSVLAGGSREDRLSLVRLDTEVREFYSDMLEATSRAAGSQLVRSHTSIANLMRVVWTLVPPKLFSSSNPDFTGLARASLHDRFGVGGTETEVTHLAVVFKRLRQYIKIGRRGSSLDLELISHSELLARQSGRCNHCKFEFNSDYYRYAAEEDGVAADAYEKIDGEVTLERTYRSPELDHIIPFVLGGDDETNWQILCAACNRGKSDLLTYFAGHHSAAAGRTSDLFSFNAAKRYAVVAEGEVAALIPGDGRFFRIFKRNADGFLNAENLHAEYL